jgi:hypothetical protein
LLSGASRLQAGTPVSSASVSATIDPVICRKGKLLRNLIS